MPMRCRSGAAPACKFIHGKIQQSYMGNLDLHMHANTIPLVATTADVCHTRSTAILQRQPREHFFRLQKSFLPGPKVTPTS